MRKLPVRQLWFLLTLPGLLSLPAFAVQVSWTPERPALDDRITIRIEGVEQAAWLHWGVNARGAAWQTPIPAYQPPASRLDGLAVQTPFRPVKGATTAVEVVLGPFNHPSQTVCSVDFAILFEDNTWESRAGDDYHILVSQARISTAPAQPGPNDLITVYIARSAPGGYLRWGVNARRGEWVCPAPALRPLGSIPSADGAAVDTPIPPPGRAGISTLTLGPFDQAVQVVTSLHMAAHWQGVWDTDCGRNYEAIIHLVPSGQVSTLDFMAPEDGDLFTRDFSALLASREPVTLCLDGRELATLLREPFSQRIALANLSYGRHLLSASAGLPGRKKLAAVEFWHAPSFRREDYPDDAPLGVTPAPDGTCTFALHAPGKRFVSLLGDFNQWNPSAHPMHQSSNGVWWLDLALPPGTHHYQYLIEGTQPLADPYSRDVEWNDAAGRETHQPELARSVLSLGQPPFPWSNSFAYQRPALSNLILYELSIPDVSSNGFAGLVRKLDYIRDLGVTAIEPLPWNEFPGGESWGYNPAFHFAPETAYGSPDELKTLMDQAHQRGLAVIMDTVLNHMDARAPLFQLYGDDYDASPWFRLFTGDNWGFPDLDQPAPAFKRYADDLLRFWSLEYRVDGFRYDATRWVGWAGYNDHGASWFAYCARRADPQSIQIAEHLPSDPDLVNLTEMDSGWSAEFRWRISDLLQHGQFDPAELTRLLQPLSNGFSNALQNVIYLESHDEERLFAELARDYPLEEATRRAAAGLALTLTAPGIPMLYAGQEWGEATPKTVGHNPLHWERLNDPLAATLHQTTRELCRLRTRNAALKGDHLEILRADGEAGVIAYRRAAPPHEVLVAVNAGKTPTTITLPFTPGVWRVVPAPGLRRIKVPLALDYPLPPGTSLVLEKIQAD